MIFFQSWDLDWIVQNHCITSISTWYTIDRVVRKRSNGIVYWKSRLNWGSGVSINCFWIDFNCVHSSYPWSSYRKINKSTQTLVYSFTVGESVWCLCFKSNLFKTFISISVFFIQHLMSCTLLIHCFRSMLIFLCFYSVYWMVTSFT